MRKGLENFLIIEFIQFAKCSRDDEVKPTTEKSNNGTKKAGNEFGTDAAAVVNNV